MKTKEKTKETVRNFAKQVAKKFTSWSFSRYSDWVLCPLKAKLAHLDKLPQEKGPALVRGADVHKEAEAFLKGGIRALPKSLVMFTDLLTELRDLRRTSPDRVLVEENWGFTKDWEPCAWDDWDRCWLRVKVDCLELSEDGRTGTLRDWKTGRFSAWQRGQYQEQLELYAAAALSQVPEIQVVRPGLYYLDEGRTWDQDVLTGKTMAHRRSGLATLRKRWSKRVLPMLKDQAFLATPNNLCRWCPWRAEAGGPCVH